MLQLQLELSLSLSLCLYLSYHRGLVEKDRKQ